jgi:hypothetical protein
VIVSAVADGIITGSPPTLCIEVDKNARTSLLSHGSRRIFRADCFRSDSGIFDSEELVAVPTTVVQLNRGSALCTRRSIPEIASAGA